MAMLAEPRQKKSYVLVPRGKALYEDDTRFGTKMLKKMGWSKGKGLGANENGTQDFVRVRHKKHTQGLGFEDRDDQWTQHEESFSGLLQALNGGVEKGNSGDASGCENDSAAEDTQLVTAGFGFSSSKAEKKTAKKLIEKFSGESLEAKSKQSKARVHYQKFTRGKDLSRYSEKDLANIFGKKGNGSEATQQSNDLYQQLASFAIKQPESKEAASVNDEFEGAQTTTSSLSVGDYFKQKMEAMKNKLKNGKTKTSIDGDDKEQDAFINEETENTSENINKEKKKKRQRQEEIDKDNLEELVNNVNEEPKKKKTKKRKEVSMETESVSLIQEIDINSDKKSKSKKMKKVKEPEERTSNLVSVECAPHENVPKKKRTKNKNQEEEYLVESDKNVEDEKYKINAEIFKENSTENIVVNIKKSKKSKIKVAAITNNTPLETSVKDEAETALVSKISEEDNSIKDTKSKYTDSAVNSKSKKQSKKKSVSDTIDSNSNVNDLSKTETKPLELLSLDDLIAQSNLYSVYTISSFCAEKFRNTDLNRFGGSNMAAITGYAFSEDLRLDIKTIPGDADRITQLWNCTLDKYTNAQPKTMFYNYAKQVRQARKSKVKPPRFQVKTWKRKHAFQTL